ncbi:MAG: transposase [Thermofilum sp.]
MIIHPAYRTIILRLEPDRGVEKLMLKNCQTYERFVGMTRLELQKLLYRKIRDKEKYSRMIDLFVQRATGSLGGKGVLLFDKKNSKFVCENGVWFIELKLHSGEKVRVMVMKTGVPYYNVIDKFSKWPFMVTRENAKWLAYVSIPMKEKIENKVVGIDFNVKNWVAAGRTGRPVFFDASKYSAEIKRIQRLISRAMSRGNNNVGELYEKREAVVKRAHGNFLKAIREAFGVCTLAIEDVKTIYRLREKRNRMINNWLYSKTALRRFALRALAHGFNVVEVNPFGTSRTCFRCGSEATVYGDHDRLIKCEKCGLKDYNRDLNAARNIAARGEREVGVENRMFVAT